MSSKSEIAVRVRGVGKSYTLSHQGEKHVTLAESLLAKARNPFARTPKETFWALKDIDFDVKRGDVVGIIGRNGAGKSTLLKILSRITEPTTGQIDLYGRVGSLLEVGTGFHPELTGRENVFLNGAILGMTKAEIRKQFDAIVDFAGVEKFLDTPVKRYSSGMYVRLAFAVAAHLQNEILIVDEVLAVGDAEFQKRCLGKMKDVAVGGRTVLFVSHNMNAIRNLCNKAACLAAGHLTTFGPTNESIRRYAGDGGAGKPVWEREYRPRDRAVFFTNAQCEIRGRQPELELVVQITTCSVAQHPDTLLAIDISDQYDQVIMQAIPTFVPLQATLGSSTFVATVELPPLIPGEYEVSLWMGPPEITTLDQVLRCLTFEIEESPTPERRFPYSPDHGRISPVCRLRVATVGGL